MTIRPSWILIRNWRKAAYLKLRRNKRVAQGSYVSSSSSGCIKPMGRRLFRVAFCDHEAWSSCVSLVAAIWNNSKYASPAKLTDKFLEQTAVANGNSDSYCFALVIALGNVRSVKVVLRLKVHPNVGRNVKGFFRPVSTARAFNRSKRLLGLIE